MNTTGKPPYQPWLESFASAQGVMAGTVHLRRGEALELVATLNIPPPVVDAVRVIPQGKGMVGLAFATRRPVQMSDIQADDSGRVLQRARAAHASVALPVLDAAGEVHAVVGLAFLFEGRLSAEVTSALMDAIVTLPPGDL
ncbi:GAF domain-containing protein [Archangium minus]|uniref:GAF domain-containing protein n=1 Tax=Archangium minus TaxID=83450 RepID=A0ABY9X7B3_9BACT|nr:GAF domain-containing protein [Archangium minus]